MFCLKVIVILDIFTVCLQAKFNCAVKGLATVLVENPNKSPSWRVENLVWVQYPLPQEHSWWAER